MMHMRRFLVILSIAAVALLALFAIAGCGEEEKPQVDLGDAEKMLNQMTDGSSRDLEQKIEDLKKKEMTVEIIQDGDSEGKWSQNDKGSWRWDDPDDPESFVIYNADKGKMWIVNGDTALESTDQNSEAAYAGFNPALIMGAYSAMTLLPRTGGDEDTWEWEYPGQNKTVVEFNGPDGLVSKITFEDYTTESKDVTEFKYTNVDNVSDSLFELPSGITVESYDDMTGTSTSSRSIGSSTSSSGFSDEDITVP